jgi:hypothetical protein
MTKEISLSALKADIDTGMKREALRDKYTEGNNSQLNVILKAAGLKIRAFRIKSKEPKFKLINDLEVSENNSTLAVETAKGFTAEEESKMFAEAKA